VASRYLEYSRGRWYAVRETKDAEGKKLRRYTNLDIRGKDARRQAERAMREIEAREAAARALGRVTGDGTFVAEYAERYLASAELDVRPATYRSYCLWVRRFAQRYGHYAVSDVMPDMIEQWKRDLARDLSPSSVNVALRSVRAMFGRARRQRLIPHSPFDGVSLAQVSAPDFPPYWSDAQFRQVLQKVTSQRLRVGFCLAFYAGLRAREVVTLMWEDVGETEIRIVSREGAMTKSGRSRSVPLFPQLARELAGLRRVGAYVMSSKFRAVSDERTLSQKFLAYRRQHPHLPAINFHGLRHSFATGCAMRGMPLPVLQRIMGHAQITTTAMYMHVQGEDAMREALRYAPPGEEKA
jgi:integrase/recombinase XerD